MRVNLLTAVAAINVALAAALAWLWSDDSRRQWSEPAPLPPAIEENIAVAATEPAEVSRFRETLERPLFLASRRPGPKKDAASEAQEAVDLRDLKLLGTYGSGAKGGIIVSRGGKVERLPVGASIGQWKVAGGEGRGAALERANGERRTIDLVLNTTAPAGAAAKPDAAPAAAGTAQARPAPARSAGNDGGPSREVIRSQRLERLNARRAQAGLPPLPE
jgi:Tfp pilus assembly protein PilP